MFEKKCIVHQTKKNISRNKYVFSQLPPMCLLYYYYLCFTH